MLLKLFGHNMRLTTGIGIILIALVLIGYISDPEDITEVIIPEEVEVEAVVEEVVDTVPPNFYVLNGIVSDSLLLYEGTIKKNQSLSELLLPYDVSYGLIDRIAKQSKEVFDVRKFMVGKKYSIFFSEDSMQHVEAFIYEIDAANYIVFHIADSINIYRERKQVDIKIRTASGIITSSLWNTMVDNNIDQGVTMEMSEIYAWAVDFYRIQKGDWFKVIYEEKYVDGEKIGIGRILGARFNHFNEDYNAIYFTQGETSDYFDEKNKSMRKAFLKAPLKYSRISSGYSKRRFHPVQKRYKAHLGTDYAAPKGTPIMSTGNGTIEKAGYSKGNGNYVKVKHNSVYATQYLHMTNIKSGIRKGVRVKQGDIIGYVGSTGLATGPHVCYRFWKNGKQVDALKLKLPASLPIEGKYLEDYKKVRDKVLKQLDDIDVEGDVEA